MAESVVQIRWAYSNKRQSAYQTESPSGDLTQSHPFVGADMGEHTPNMSDNAQQYGKGHEFATRNEILSWESMFRRSFQATTKILGWAFAFHCGSVSTTNLGGGAYEHVCEYQDPLGTGYYGSGRQQPVATIYELVASNLLRIFPSMAVKAVEVTGQQNDWVLCAMEMQGSGSMRRIQPSDFTWPDSTDPALGGEGTLLRNASLLFEHGVYGGTQDDVSCDVRSFRFRSEYAYFDTDGYCPGSGYLVSGDPHSGQIRNKLEFARRAVVFEFVVKAPSTNNVMFTRLEAATKMAATLTVTGDEIGSSGFDHLLKIEIPQLNYRAVPIGADGDQIIYSASTIVFYDNAEANPWKVTVNNQFASYLVSS